MNMDAAAIVDSCTACAELAHKFLHRFNIFVLTDRRNKFHRIVPACRTVIPVAASDRGVAHHFPLTISIISYGICIVSAADMDGLRIEMSGDNPCRRCSCKPGHLDFNAEVLASQALSPSTTDSVPTAEEGRGGFFFAGAFGCPARKSINSRTFAGTYLP